MQKLTATQHQILQLIADGNNSYEIAKYLSLSRDTIKTYTKELYRRLDATDRANAVAVGFRKGLIT